MGFNIHKYKNNTRVLFFALELYFAKDENIPSKMISCCYIDICDVVARRNKKTNGIYISHVVAGFRKFDLSGLLLFFLLPGIRYMPIRWG